VRIVWVTVGIAATLVFVTWSAIAYRANGAAHAALASDRSIVVQHDDGAWSFSPTAAHEDLVLVFFPGALVDPVAYAPLARAVAAAGYPAFIVELPRRGAFGGADDPEVFARYKRQLRRPNTPRRWVVGGHSRGAVVAVNVAASRPDDLAGLVLIGTSHPRDVDLSHITIPVTKISGTRDGLASPAEVEANRSKLPPATRWIWIDGGNHSQFGWYGFQPGDRWADIDATRQRDTMVHAVIEMLARASGVQEATGALP
jgi:pimeloyl-ACP methyl ester carboxylesterase